MHLAQEARRLALQLQAQRLGLEVRRALLPVAAAQSQVQLPVLLGGQLEAEERNQERPEVQPQQARHLQPGQGSLEALQLRAQRLGVER